MYDETRMMFYLACPECKRKVIEEMGGFRCEKCNLVHGTCNVSYSFTAKITDLSGNVFLSFMGDTGDTIMGMTGAEFKRYKENHSPDDIRDYL